MRLHPLHTDIPKPERFTWPFCYEPHPLCLLACEEVKAEISRIDLKEGKMFGVLVVDTTICKSETTFGFLAAYSGLLEGRNDWDYFVPPVFDAQQPGGYFKQKEREISLSAGHKEMSQDLQLWLFRQYRMLNAKGEEKDLVEIWRDYHRSPKIQKKFPLPPGGTGDCCAPKLLQYAYLNHLKPVCMAEFWWGPSPQTGRQRVGDDESGLIRHHGEFYPACRGKCKPVLTWMLQGLDVDPDPESSGFLHQGIEIIYEDDAIAAVYKPAGMLSVPGKADAYSIATWAKERWADSMLPHRLDLLTSGIMLVAKTVEAYHHLQDQFAARTVKKKYLAVVEGEVAQSHGIVDLPLISDPLNRPRQRVDHEHGKRAITEFRVQDTAELEGRKVTLLALYPHTGRTHQLRMHCAHQQGLGCPIVGDELYGHKADRLYLQADSIAFVHPTSGRRMHLFCPSNKKIWKF